MMICFVMWWHEWAWSSGRWVQVPVWCPFFNNFIQMSPVVFPSSISLRKWLSLGSGFYNCLPLILRPRGWWSCMLIERGLQTLHSEITANMVKLIIRISTIKLADDLKFVLCFICMFSFYLDLYDFTFNQLFKCEKMSTR